MTDYLWKKSGTRDPDELIMSFLAGEDVLLDRHLLEFDLDASAAHANGLESIGILEAGENRQIQEALDTIRREFLSGKRVLDNRFEDGHSAIEAWLTEMLGSLGAKIHTGRSRNDQVAVAMRLYLRHQLEALSAVCRAMAGRFLDRAGEEGGHPMPGHTHLQKAMPSSTGLWLAGHAEAFIDNAEFAGRVAAQIDASPLGTASGFGINLPLARQQVADQLGFGRLVINPQYAQNSRGKAELLALGALAAATLDLRRLAWDLSLFATQEFGYISLPDRFCTGSSIMPNKNNPDVIELLRATHAVVAGAQAELNEVLALPSGYHRDLQATKPPVLRAFLKAIPALNVAHDVAGSFEWNTERLAGAVTTEMFATDQATRLAAEGRPFREAYRDVGDQLSDLGGQDIRATLDARVSPGASADLMLESLRERLRSLTPEAG